MESEKTTPDRKVKNLLSSYVSKSLDEQGRKRKRSLTEIQSESTVQAPPDRERKQNVDSQDEDAFFERVETYDMMSWFAKPMELSPLVCSRFGWKNTESDMLQCVGCKAVLCGQLPKLADSLIYHESCKKLKDSLRMAHMKSCFWPAYPSPEYFSSIPIKNKRKVTSRIIAYLESLQKLQEHLPQVSFKTFDDKGMSANYLEEIKCTVEKQFEQNHLDNVEVGTFCLAVTGWKGINSKAALLSCHFCRRKVGLWNYKNNHNKDDASEVSSEDSDTEEKYSDSKSAILVIESETCTDNSNNHQETNQDNSSNSSVQSDDCVEKCFNFSQPNVIDNSISIDSQKLNEEDTSLSVQSNISSGNIYSFSQPDILECSNDKDNLREIVDGVVTNECNKMSENGKSETTNDTIINEQNKLLSNGKHDLKSLESSSSELLSNGKHDLKSLESSSSENNTNVKENDSLSEKIELKQDHVKESQASSNSSLEEGNPSNDKSVEESHMSSDKSVEESHMSSDKSVEESHMSSDKSVEESHMSSDKSVEESHMSSDKSVEDVSSQKNSTGALQNNDTNVAEVAEPPKRKKIKVVKKDTFDPLEEHRYWCPWINELPEGITCSPKKISEMTEGGERKTSYPWEHVLQIICPSYFNVSHEDSVSEHFKKHSPVAGLRQLRNLMKEWSN